jgi:hypothetical protein
VDGLEAAQAVGVLHRDIKPANCFVDGEGRVKIGDFGLSISTAGRGDLNLTSSGVFRVLSYKFVKKGLAPSVRLW